jgi:DNA polymerase eta
MSSVDTTTTMTMTTMPLTSDSMSNSTSAAHATPPGSTAQQQQRQRVILLLDLDCFYAQCECVRLGMDATTTPLALLQWNSVLAVTYPARERFHIKRGDSWDEVREKSNGQCYAVSVPILATGDANTTKEDMNTEGTEMSGEEDPMSNINSNKDKDSTISSTTSTTTVPHSLEHDYNRIFLTTPQQQEAARRTDLGVRKFSSDGKACIERYRVASARIFETVHEWIAETAEQLGLEKKDQVVLERASIDEFFLDVSAACCDSNISTDNGRSATTATVHSFWENLIDPALAKTVRIGGESSSSSSSSGEGKSFLEPSAWSTADPDLKALYRGCALAYGIRQAVYDRIGFTLSAGVSINKTLAKLSAGYGKPQGQALTEPLLVSFLLQDTQINKCRNLGGKLGKKVQALLPTGVPTTVGSIARYLSLPDLRQGLQDDAGCALWVYQVSRGMDSEKVAPKTDVALTKSITAFKSLPFSATGHSLNNASTLQWIQLLAQEVVTRVEQDAVRHGRYPRSCSIQYALAVPGGGASNRNNTSIRTHFPAQRLSVFQRIADLVARVPALIETKEVGGGSSNSDKKAVPTASIHRVGLCAIDFVTRQSNNAIDSYFASASASASSASASTPAAAGEGGVASSASELPQARPALSTTATEVTPAVDPDLELAKKLQASYDREDRVLQVLEKKGGAVTRRPPKTRKISTFFTKR